MSEEPNKLDNFKLLMEEKLGAMGEMRISAGTLGLMGFLGLLLLITGLWLSVKDLAGVRAFHRTSEQSEKSIEQISQIAGSLHAVVADKQLQALALQVLDEEKNLDELRAFAIGKVAEVNDVQVFPPDLNLFDPMQNGDNGFAVFDMLRLASEGYRPPLQMHGSLQPPMLVVADALKIEEKIRGFVVLQVKPSFVLDRFKPDVSGSYLKLTQFNGRQEVTELKKMGSEDRVELSPQRTPIPGTLFRLEMPMAAYTNILSVGTLITMLLVGAMLLAAVLFFYRKNQAWELERIARKLAEDEIAYQEKLKQPEPAKDDAGFEQLEDHSGDAGEPRTDPSQGKASQAPEPPPMRLRYDIADRPHIQQRGDAVELTPEIFRAYDIRGIIGKTLDEGIANLVGKVLGSMALEKDAGPVVVARDGRLSGPALVRGMIDGIASTGCDVLDIGMVPTGVLYYAAFEHAKGTGVMITGSHNPPDYNGLKIMLAGDTLHGEQIKEIYHRIGRNEVLSGEGSTETRDVVPEYRQRIASDIQLERPLRVVIDCGNGVGGVCAADVLRDIGAEVLPLFDEVDGTFPNHHPDPSDPKNLQDLIESVRLMNADIGLALDGDADRLGVVTLGGQIIYPDRIMMLLAMDVLDRVPGATIIYDVKCTSHLPKVIEAAGGKAVMYKTGHSLIKARMKEIGSPFAGEMSGHFFFGERWYGVDDGIYGAARLLEILAGTDEPPEAILNSLPSSYSTPELKIEMEEGENHAFIDAMQAVAKFDGATVSTIDGIRADFDDGWGLVRASNTTPVVVVRFDGETEEALKRIKNVFRARILEINPDLELPF